MLAAITVGMLIVMILEQILSRLVEPSEEYTKIGSLLVVLIVVTGYMWLVGMRISAYYPHLLTKKFYFTVKSPKLFKALL